MAVHQHLELPSMSRDMLWVVLPLSDPFSQASEIQTLPLLLAWLYFLKYTNLLENLFNLLLRKFVLYQTFTGPLSPWQNWSEPKIGEVKCHYQKRMLQTNTPMLLWCFCSEYTADLLSLCASGRFDIQGWTAYKAEMKYTPDISEYVSFS